MAPAAAQPLQDNLGDVASASASAVGAAAGGLKIAGDFFNNMNPLSSGFLGGVNVLPALIVPNGITAVVACVAAVPDAIEAVKKLSEGDIVGAAQKTVRAAANAAIAFTPAGAIIDLGSRILTGKGLVDHFGDLINNVTEMFTGSNHAEKTAKVDSAIDVPATVAVGAGLAANQYISPKGNQYTLGGLPQANTVEVNAAPAIKGVNQVMPASYPRALGVEEVTTAERNREEEQKQAQAYVEENPFAGRKEGMPERYFMNSVEDKAGLERGQGLQKSTMKRGGSQVASIASIKDSPSTIDEGQLQQLAAQLAAKQGMTKAELEQNRAEQRQGAEMVKQ